MELFILSPRHKQSYEIDWLDLHTSQGNFVIKRGHAPMIIDLLPHSSFTFALENGVQKSVQIRTGIASIMRDQTTIFISEEHD